MTPKPKLKDVLSKYEPLSEYEQGYVAALTDYAIWKDGVQRVGAFHRTLAEEVDYFLRGRPRIGGE